MDIGEAFGASKQDMVFGFRNNILRSKRFKLATEKNCQGNCGLPMNQDLYNLELSVEFE